ncbi:hypothetical protein AB0L53_47720 [Nonomuraea sp. NPDC052129]|uniref:hypothetical protein n=1 Tax=Nonomuraea sp. NPDC052129 TaxID=3154651 RepID=UPI003433D1A8
MDGFVSMILAALAAGFAAGGLSLLSDRTQRMVESMRRKTSRTEAPAVSADERDPLSGIQVDAEHSVLQVNANGGVQYVNCTLGASTVPPGPGEGIDRNH